MDTLAQLPLCLPIRDDATFANFFPGHNQQAVFSIKQLASQQGERFIYCWGNAGSGRSHLLQAACHLAQEQDLSSLYLPMQQHQQLTPDICDDLDHCDLVCIDDIDAIAGDPRWEEALFHAYNLLKDQEIRLLITASATPAHCGFQLADLRSRLDWGVCFQLQALSDDEKIAALQLRAKQRGLTLTDEVCTFLLNRCTRDMNTLFSYLEQLDKASWQAQRRLTIPFVKSVLGF